MLGVEQLEEWLGQEVLDSGGERVGKLDEVYYSGTTEEAIFAVVKSGLLGRHASLVPLSGASVGRDYLRLAYSAAQIDQAGSGLSAGETLERDDAQRLGAAYGVEVPAESFASASSINERRRAGAEAGARAEELEEQARRRAAEAEQAQSNARDATAEASARTDEAERVRIEAEQAHVEAQRIDPAERTEHTNPS